MTFLVTFLATVVILVVLRKLLWLSQGLFLPAGVFFIAKKHKNRLASVIFAKMDFTITPMITYGITAYEEMSLPYSFREALSALLKGPSGSLGAPSSSLKVKALPTFICSPSSFFGPTSSL